MKDLKTLMDTVSTNAAQIEWPRDEWGFTSELRKIIGLTAGKIKGNPKKQALVVQTLMIGLAHVKARADKDLADKAARGANINKQAEERKPLERFHTYSKKVA